MALDAVCALKVESIAEGGSTNDATPTELSPRQDALTAAGLFLQNILASASDKTVLIDRTAGNMRLADQATSRLLSELVTSVTGQVGSHDGLRDLQHFLAGEGPGPGFASGLYFVRNFSGPLVTSETWYTNVNMANKIVSKTLAYAAGSPVPSTITWVVYNAAGTAIRTLVDSLVYSGPVCYAVNRTWS